MNFGEFRVAFFSELEEAASVAESLLDCQVPRAFEVELHGAGYSGTTMSPEEAVQILYLNEDEFYRIVDIGVLELGETKTRVFVRASAHEPSTFGDTWNTPPGRGPFKQIGPVGPAYSLVKSTAD